MAYNRPVIIDTNAFSLLLRGDAESTRVIGTAQQVALPVVVVAELRAGFLHGRKSEKYSRALDEFLEDPRVTVLEITSEAVDFYAELYAYSRSLGRQLSQNDLWIAALCLLHGWPLFTHDRDFDALPQVRRVHG